MKKLLILVAVIFSTACSNGAKLGVGDYADAVATAAVIAQGGVELNPAIGWAGDASPVAALGVKYLSRIVMIDVLNISPDIANRGVEAGGWLGACNNILYLAGVAMPASLIGGAVCAAVFWNAQ